MGYLYGVSKMKRVVEGSQRVILEGVIDKT